VNEHFKHDVFDGMFVISRKDKMLVSPFLPYCNHQIRSSWIFFKMFFSDQFISKISFFNSLVLLYWNSCWENEMLQKYLQTLEVVILENASEKKTQIDKLISWRFNSRLKRLINYRSAAITRQHLTLDDQSTALKTRILTLPVDKE